MLFRSGQEYELRRGPRAEERPEPTKPPHPVTLRIKPAASTAATVQDSAPQRVIAAPCRSASAATSPGTTQPIPSDGGTNGARTRRTASASSMAAPTRSRPYSPEEAGQQTQWSGKEDAQHQGQSDAMRRGGMKGQHSLDRKSVV